MHFEKKTVKAEKPKTTFYTILKFYWIIIPSIYFILLYMGAGPDGLETLYSFEDFLVTLSQAINLGLAGLLHVIEPLERSKNGVADIFLKVTIGQQLVILNIFGILLSFLAWRELPNKVDPKYIEDDENSFYLKNKVILVLLVIIVVLSLAIAFGNWRLS